MGYIASMRKLLPFLAPWILAVAVHAKDIGLPHETLQMLLEEQFGAVYDGSRLFKNEATPPASPKPPKPLLVLDPSDMDPSADPCVDFYQYSCGTWLKNNPVPADQSRWMRYQQLDELTLVQLRDILEAAAKRPKGQSQEQRKMGDLYASCMDEESVEAKGLSPVKPELARVASLAAKEDLAVELARLHQQGIGALFYFGSAQDYQRSSRMIAWADQGGLSLPDRDYYLSEDSAEDRKKYLLHLERMFQLAGQSQPAAAEHAQRVLRVETALARISADIVSRRNPSNVHNKMSLEQLQRLTPSFPWDRYLRTIGAPPFKALDVASTGFFAGLEAVLQDHSLDDWKSYLRWQLLHANADLLPKAFVQEDFAFFDKELGGQQEIKARWKSCVGLVDANMGDALGKAYVERHFGPEQKQRAHEMIAAIESVMKDNIRGLDWMSAPTKRRALRKLRSIANKIGYPERWKSYRDLSISRRALLRNARSASAFEFRRRLGKIGGPVDRGEWWMTPPTDNAYYDPQMNDINFPAGILQPPLFDLSADMAVNYGATGATMGHELIHAFDDEGRRYDAQGNLRDWWNEEDARAFDARAKAFVDQYSEYVVGKDPDNPGQDIKLNGKLTLGENLADNGGLILSFIAYKRGAKDARPADGLTPDQRFFVAYGQSWCGNQTPESAKNQAKSNPHSTGKYRVNGVVSNMPEFREAFGCKADAPMVRQPPNRVW